ncbi:MAG: APC family permease [Clostridia bacterium]
MTANISENQPKKLRAVDLFLGIVVIMLFLDSGTSASAMGLTTVTWYIILSVIFFLPMALITAELGAAYPDDGGLYHWVKISQGAANASRTAWYYWVNVAIWVGSAALFIMDVCSEMLGQLFGVEIPFFVYLAASCVLCWIYVFLANQPQEESTLGRNIGGIAKLCVVIALLVTAVVYLIKNGGQPATEFALSEFKPTMGAAFAFFPALIYNIMGFDAISSIGGSNIKDPGKDLPRMIILGLIVMAIMYILITIGICIITPWQDIDIINGIPNCFLLTFDGGFGTVLYVLIGIVFLYTLISQGPAWMQASGFMAVASVENYELPAVFGKTTKKGAPLGSNILMGIVSSGLIIAYGLLASFAGDSVSELFWTLFSFTSLIFFIPFLFCCISFIKLRTNDKDTFRPYRFPGPDIFGKAVAVFCMAVILFVMILFFWVPGQPVDWVSSVALGIGFVVCIVLGEIFNYNRKRKIAQSK